MHLGGADYDVDACYSDTEMERLVGVSVVASASEVEKYILSFYDKRSRGPDDSTLDGLIVLSGYFCRTVCSKVICATVTML